MTQEFVTLPRDVVKQAVASIEMLNAGKWTQVTALAATLRAALDQPKNHVSDAGNMVPTGWKLVPVEPNCSMVLTGERSLEQHDFLRLDSAYRAMLAAAPQPPTTEDCSVVLPQANQPAMTPIAQRKLEDLMASGYTISGYSVYHERKHQHGFVTGAGLVGWWRPEGMEYSQPLGEQEPVAWMKTWDSVGHARTGIKRVDLTPECETWLANMFPVITPLYTHPQPKRNPLTDEQIDAIADAMPGGLEGFMKGWGWRQFARAVIDATHNIK